MSANRQLTPDHPQPHFKPFSVAAFKAAWLDESLTRAQIAGMFGVKVVQIWRRAKALGLPARRKGGPRKSFPEAFVRAAWMAGVSSHEIASRAGISNDTLFRSLAGLGLPLRGSGAQPKMTLMEFDQDQLRLALAASARETQAALWDADMVDGDRRRRAA
jgi:hypothetical protein